jgi:hypothetical protein
MLQDIDLEIADQCLEYYADPLGFVMWAFPWGEKGSELQNYYGPDEWQERELRQIGKQVVDRNFDGVKAVLPIQRATASGHGIGKSALTSWIILWLMSTRPRCRGTVTANTSDQLKTKTWGELSKWKDLCITGHWFDYYNSKGNMNLRHIANPEKWRVDAYTCREENSEAFAGQHAIDSTSFYIFDEASNVPSKIWEVAEGGLTDGEPMFFVYGNPTRNHGRFFDCFNRQRDLWVTHQIDSRDCRFPNKELHKRWIKVWGVDSDYVRVRIRGMFPRAGDMQFIPSDVVSECMKCDVRSLDDDALIMGIDVARGGEDRNVIVYRKGRDARSFPTYIIPGEKTRDTMLLVSKITDLCDPQRARHYKGHALVPDAIFVDETGLGGPIVDRLRQLNLPVFGVNFGSAPFDKQHFVNRAAEMWFRMREWLMSGGAIKDHPELEMDLTARGFSHNSKDQLVLESKDDMKKRDLASPDWGDALALTFATSVAKVERDSRTGYELGAPSGKAISEYDPMDYNL